MLEWFRALMPREDRFFDLFAAHADVLVQGASALNSLLEGGSDVDRQCEKIIALEDQADQITRDVLLAVRKSFITPFDRGDIKDLIQSMDDAIDMMQVTVKKVVLFEVKEFEPNMQAMGGVIVETAKLTADAIPLLNRPGTHVMRLAELTEEIIRAEGRADDLHDAGLKALFGTYGRSEPMTFYVRSQIYDALERVVDRFEDVANEISGIVLENV